MTGRPLNPKVQALYKKVQRPVQKADEASQKGKSKSEESPKANIMAMWSFSWKTYRIVKIHCPENSLQNARGETKRIVLECMVSKPP